MTTPIPFQLERVNEGNAMDLTSGKFTAPRPGIYFFSFTGQTDLQRSSASGLGVALYLNGGLIGTSENEEANTFANQNNQVTLQSTLLLNKGDQVWVEILWMASGAYLYDEDGYHHNHFTGFMLKEEIVASF
jgi:hypothetical protein